MRLGIAGNVKHSSPEEWASKLSGLGCRAAIIPLGGDADPRLADAYAEACRKRDIVIAEVGAWVNALHPDPEERRRNVERCQTQLRFAERLGARCCVNIAGARGPQWDGAYKENYSEETYSLIVESVREIIDAVNPSRTFYTLEPMPWMLPDGPESYLRLIQDVKRPGFAVHLDVVNMISTPERFLFNAEFMEKCFRLLGPYIKSCHLKDVRLEPFLTFNLKEVSCGQGSLDIARYISLIDELDPETPLIIEHLNTEEEYVSALKYVNAINAN